MCCCEGRGQLYGRRRHSRVKGSVCAWLWRVWAERTAGNTLCLLASFFPSLQCLDESPVGLHARARAFDER